MNITEIAIDAIKIDCGTQARVSINEGAVAEYAEAMTEGEALPPVVVFFDGADYFLADGFHRYHANRRIGARTLAADVRTGTLAGAKLFAYGANRGHGLQRTNADKRKAVLGMLADAPDWSDRAIARHVGVSHPFVAAVRSPAAAARQNETRTVGGAPKVETVSTQPSQQGARDAARADEPTLKPAASSPADRPANQSGDGVNASTPPPTDARDATIKELAEELKATLAELATAIADRDGNEAVRDADDKLAEALEQNKQLRAEVTGLRERVNGLMGEKNQAIGLVKHWKGRAERAEKAGATA